MDEASSKKPTFEDVVNDNADKIYALACRLLGTASGAEDLVQESFIRAFRFYGSFRGESSVDTWLYRITVNVWKNRVRSEKRRAFWKTISLFSADDNKEKTEPSLTEKTLSPDASLENSETTQVVQGVLLRLDPEEKTIVTLRDMEDKSYAEIAEILSLPKGTVKSRLFRARESLRKLMEKDYASH